MARRAAKDDPDAISVLEDLKKVIEAKQAEVVAVHRANGASWTEIGESLGISRQAAFQRWGGAR